jgi:hypothetical protein
MSNLIHLKHIILVFIKTPHVCFPIKISYEFPVEDKDNEIIPYKLSSLKTKSAQESPPQDYIRSATPKHEGSLMCSLDIILNHLNQAHTSHYFLTILHCIYFSFNLRFQCFLRFEILNV